MSQINMKTVSEVRKMAREYGDKALALEKAADAMESIVGPNVAYRVELTAPSHTDVHPTKAPHKGSEVYRAWKFLRDQGPKTRAEITKGLKINKNYMRTLLTAGKSKGYFLHDGKKGSPWSVYS